MRGRRWLRLGVLLGLVAATTVVGMPAATAAPTTSTGPAAAPKLTPQNADGVHVFSVKKAASATSLAGPAVITCYSYYQNPTTISPGGPFPAEVVGVNTLTLCTYPVDIINLSIRLYWNYNLWASGGDVRAFQSAASATATGVCLDGSYYGSITMAITFPPGYYPNRDQLDYNTSFVNIDCI